MNCRLCDKERPLIKAHIIPEGFFRVLRDETEVPHLLTNKPGAYPKKAPIGVYDKSILCKDCDQIFAPWDDHAQQVMLHEFSNALPIEVGQTRFGWRIDRFDYSQLKLFFISLLWRASVSMHDFYRKVSLGRFEDELKDIIRKKEPGPADAFAVTLAKFDHPDLTCMLDPHTERFHGINYCRFYLAGFTAHIKVDHRPSP